MELIVGILQNCVIPEDRLQVNGARASATATMPKSDHRKSYPNGGGSGGALPGYTTTSELTYADPLELHQMSASISITKHIPNLPISRPMGKLKQEGAGSNSLLKARPETAHGGSMGNGYPFMNGSSPSSGMSGMKQRFGDGMMMSGRGKRGGGMSASIVPSMSHQSRKMEAMMQQMHQQQNGFGHQQQMMHSKMSNQIVPQFKANGGGFGGPMKRPKQFSRK